jgi:hypothetical protein
MSQAERIAKALDSSATSSGNDDGSVSWKTKCPSHVDKKASLSVTQAGDRVLVRCHAGCSQGQVIESLKRMKLWISRKRKPEDNEHWEWAGAAELGSEISIRQSPQDKRNIKRAAKHWLYHDAEGKLLGAVYRFEEPDGTKDIRPVTLWHNSGSGELLWRFKAWPGARPLYNWNLLNQYRDYKVLVVEGEKTADAANALLPEGWIATTWPGGTKAINRANWDILRGRTVVMWPDNDDVGILAMENLGSIADRSGFSSFKGVYPPKDILPPKWDLADSLPDNVNISVMNLIETAGEVNKVDPNKVSSTFGPPIMLESEVCDLLNERFAAVDLAGKPYILVYPDEIDPEPRLGSYDDYAKLYSNMKFIDTASGKIKKQIPTWWEHSNRKTYNNGITFEPSKPKEFDGKYNTWQGFSVHPSKEGSCDLFLRHIQDNVADGDTWAYEWIMMWFSDIIQNPSVKSGTCLALRGQQGCGKSIVGEVFGAILGGDHYLVVDETETLFGKNNLITMKALLIQAEEAFWAGSKRDLGKIKHLITSHQHSYEDKFVKRFKAPNYSRLFVTSNEQWVVPAAADDRRFTVLDVNGRHARDREYFGEMIRQLEDGGYNHLMWIASQYDIDKNEIGDPLESEARDEQKTMTMDIVDAWLYQALSKGILIPERATSWQNTVYSHDVLASIAEFARKRQQIRNTPGQKTIANRLSIIFKDRFTRKVSTKPIKAIDESFIPRPSIYKIDCTLQEARGRFQKYMGAHLYWEDEGVAEVTLENDETNVTDFNRDLSRPVPF